MNIRDINPNPHNPRKISGERLKKLERYLAEYGDLSGIVYNSNPECQALVSGHQRMQVFRKGNGKPVILERYDPPQADGTVARGFIELKSGHRYVYREVHWQKEKADAATIIANGQFGEWDGDMLANAFQFDMPELREMGVPEFVFGGVGEIGEGGNTLNREKQEVQEDDYEIPDEIKTDIVPGDLFEIGPHRLLCGDSTNADDVAKLLKGEKPFLMVTDPPYGVAYIGKTKDALKIQNDAMSEDQTHGLWRDCLSAVWPFFREGGGIYATVPPGRLQLGFMQVMKDFGALRQVMVWNKDSMVLGHSDYHYKHEPVLYGWKPGAAHYFTDDRTQTTVLDFDRPKASREHPTMKPVALWAKFIENSSQRDSSVYDPFLGSGTTMVAAHQLNRRCYGMEIDPQYCQVIVDRMLKLDPTLEIKRNGQPYLKTTI